MRGANAEEKRCARIFGNGDFRTLSGAHLLLTERAKKMSNSQMVLSLFRGYKDKDYNLSRSFILQPASTAL